MKKEILHRSLATDVQLREAGEAGKRTIEGFIPFNSRSEFMGFWEYITPTAFNKTIADGADVRALMNHDSNKLLGRVKNGSLRLRTAEDGLHIECDLPSTTYADDVYNLIREGYNTGLSFGFSIEKEDYGEEDGVSVHYLREVRLYEVSFAVSFPAYEATDTSARNIRGIDLAPLNETLNHEDLSSEDEDMVRTYIEKLNNLLKPAETREITEAGTTTPAEPEQSEQFRAYSSKLDALMKGVIND